MDFSVRLMIFEPTQ